MRGMMRKGAAEVIRAFLCGHKRKVGHIHTDGRTLNSYGATIAGHMPDGSVYVIQDTELYKWSRTTMSHIQAIKEALGSMLCMAHEDCRETPELGRACLQGVWAHLSNSNNAPRNHQ